MKSLQSLRALRTGDDFLLLGTNFIKKIILDVSTFDVIYFLFRGNYPLPDKKPSFYLILLLQPPKVKDRRIKFVNFSAFNI